MALLNPCIKFKTSFEALWKCHIRKISITCSRVRQIQGLGQSKYKLRLFSKRTYEISNILFINVLYESLVSPFLGIHNFKKQKQKKQSERNHFFSKILTSKLCKFRESKSAKVVSSLITNLTLVAVTNSCQCRSRIAGF